MPVRANHYPDPSRCGIGSLLTGRDNDGTPLRWGMIYGPPQRDWLRVVTAASGYSTDGPVRRGPTGSLRRFVSRNAAMYSLIAATVFSGPMVPVLIAPFANQIKSDGV